MEGVFDLAVIGGGPGGYVAAIRALQLGLKVAVIEERQMGGTCLNRGCIPTKALLHAAEVYETVRNASVFGVDVEKATFDYNRITSRKEAIVNQLRAGVEQLVMGNGGIIISGRGYIKDTNTVEVSGADQYTVTCGKMIIATGSKPSKLNIPGGDLPFVTDSDGILELKTVPSRMVIIGGGVIGMEFASLFSAFGCEVAIIEMMDQILPGLDREVAATIRKKMEARGIRISTDSRLTGMTRGTGVNAALCTYEQAGAPKTAEGDIVLVAVGRRPCSDGIGTESTGISVEKGYINVNDLMQTNIEGIYAIGDVTGKTQLAHVASAQGFVAAANAAGQNKKMDYSAVPSCIYTSPEIASIGLSEEECRRRGRNIKVGRFPVSMNGKSKIIGERSGFAKIIADEGTGEIIGAHIVSPRATDMITEIAAAMKFELTISDIADTIHPHPTVSEIIMEAAHDADALSVHKPASRIK